MRKTVAALALGIFIGTAAVRVGAAIPIIPMSTPAEVITQVNAYLGGYLSLSGNTGELQFFNGRSWATNSNVATTMTSLGPQGASTTVSKWLTVVDNTGNVGFIPWYKYTP